MNQIGKVSRNIVRHIIHHWIIWQHSLFELWSRPKDLRYMVSFLCRGSFWSFYGTMSPPLIQWLSRMMETLVHRSKWAISTVHRSNYTMSLRRPNQNFDDDQWVRMEEFIFIMEIHFRRMHKIFCEWISKLLNFHCTMKSHSMIASRPYFCTNRFRCLVLFNILSWISWLSHLGYTLHDPLLWHRHMK